MRAPRVPVAGLLALAIVAPAAAQDHPDVGRFFQAASADRGTQRDALEEIEEHWRNGYAIMLVELARLLPSGKAGASDNPLGAGMETETRDLSGGEGGDGDPLTGGGSRFASRRDPRVQAREALVDFLQDRTGQKLGDDWTAWMRWIWSQPYDPHPDYPAFKAEVYAGIDARFRNYYQGTSTIRLDEVQWGGVRADGIPPLDHPKMVPAADAGYLADDNVVFGFVASGEARAYPKRILAWHEMLYDRVGGQEMTVVYCTLCGTVIAYSSEVGTRVVRFGTSGMLYRSNKLMYDAISWTLWSSLTGEPVSGRMVGSGLRLEPLPVVTTTWGQWKALHPETAVLSLDTGFQRDYSEGAAYAAYFATDDLMFPVARTDGRLANKAEILAIRFPREGQADAALAISADFLSRNPVYQVELDGRRLVVVTSADGANRVYDAGGTEFTGMQGEGAIVDSTGTVWNVSEDRLLRADGSGAPLPRVPAFRAFWFGWYAQYPETRLISD